MYVLVVYCFAEGLGRTRRVPESSAGSTYKRDMIFTIDLPFIMQRFPLSWKDFLYSRAPQLPPTTKTRTWVSGASDLGPGIWHLGLEACGQGLGTWGVGLATWGQGLAS